MKFYKKQIEIKNGAKEFGLYQIKLSIKDYSFKIIRIKLLKNK